MGKFRTDQLTNHFSRSELRCKCGCGAVHVDVVAVNRLEAFRQYLERPLTINSACRCPKHNTAVGGAAESYHLCTAARPCFAFDIKSPGMDEDNLMMHLEYFERCGPVPSDIFTGRGTYSEGFIHIDTGHSTLTRWTRINGVYKAITKFPY